MRPNLLTILSVFCTLFLSANLLRGQAKTSSPQAQGWGDMWGAPVTDQQRKAQEFANRCKALQKAGNLQAVVELCTGELRQQPDFLPGYAMRAITYAQLKKYDLAVADLDRAGELADHKNRSAAKVAVLIARAQVNERRSDYRAATGDLRAALKIDRSEAEAMNNLAWLLATAPDSAVRDGREAVGLAKRALTAAPDNQAYGVKDTLAAAYAESNDYPRAAKTEAEAMDAARKTIEDPAKQTRFQQEAAGRLRLFEQRQPYRLPQTS